MTLRVKLEIVPCGREDEAYEIGRLDIFNKGEKEGSSFMHRLCEYGVIQIDGTDAGLFDKTVDHIREDGAWKLVAKVIRELEIDGP